MDFPLKEYASAHMIAVLTGYSHRRLDFEDMSVLFCHKLVATELNRVIV